MTDAIIQVTQLNKSFAGPDEQVHAVQDVSFSIEPKEFVSLHGPSGCGKSTLLLMLGGLLSPDSGEIQIKNQNPYALSSNERARFRAAHIGFVFQQFHLIPFLNVLDNVLVPELAKDIVDAKGKAEQLLKDFQMQDRLGHVPSKLSVGEQQRVALARALLNDPPVILADEPTGNLDEENSEVVLDALAKAAASGKAVVMVTHDEKARARSDRSIALKKGVLVS